MIITDEIVEMAVAVFTKTEIDNIHTGFSSCIRTALEAVAPVLIAQGMREAAEMAHQWTENDILPVSALAILARAQELDPQ